MVIVVVVVVVILDGTVVTALHRRRFVRRHRPAVAVVVLRTTASALAALARSTLALPVLAGGIAAASQPADRLHVGVVESDPDAALQALRQHDVSVANADESTDGEAYGVEQPAHLAVATLVDDDPVPAVRALASTIFDRLERGALAGIDVDAFEQFFSRVFVERAEHAHRVFALDTEARMHQLVRELAGVGEQQQPFGVDVEPADRQPLALLQPRQLAKHGRAILRIVVRDDLAGRLVIRDDTRRRRRDAYLDGLARDPDLVAPADPLADVRRFAVDGDSPFDESAVPCRAASRCRLAQAPCAASARRARRPARAARAWLRRSRPLRVARHRTHLKGHRRRPRSRRWAATQALPRPPRRPSPSRLSSSSSSSLRDSPAASAMGAELSWAFRERFLPRRRLRLPRGGSAPAASRPPGADASAGCVSSA